MNEVAFFERREPEWKRINYLLDRADASIQQLTPEELREFVMLYKRLAADLALARTRSVNMELIEFLNDLTGRAYATLYRSPRNSVGSAIMQGIAMAAQAVRRLRWFAFVGAAVLFGSAIWAHFVLTIRPEAKSVIVPRGLEENFEEWKTGKHQEATGESALTMTFFYAANNPAVSITTGAAAAATFGLFTVESLYKNGLILGALYHELLPEGKVDHLLYSIAPHGVTELSGIILAGAAGLSLGWALICPGRRKRGAALAHASKDALTVLTTAVMLMFIAAPIEGFLSFNPHVPNAYKAAFAVASAIGWAAFWIGYARETPAEAASK